MSRLSRDSRGLEGCFGHIFVALRSVLVLCHSVVVAALEFPVCLRGSHSFLLIRVALMLFFSFLACSWFWEHRFNSSFFFLAFSGQWRSAIFSHSRSATFCSQFWQSPIPSGQWAVGDDFASQKFLLTILALTDS